MTATNRGSSIWRDRVNGVWLKIVLDENKANADHLKHMEISFVKGKRKGKGIKIGI